MNLQIKGYDTTWRFLFFTLSCPCANRKQMNSLHRVVVHGHRSGVFIADFEKHSNTVWCFYCSFWTGNCRLGSSKFIFSGKLIFSICFARFALMSVLLLQFDNIANLNQSHITKSAIKGIAWESVKNEIAACACFEQLTVTTKHWLRISKQNWSLVSLSVIQTNDSYPFGTLSVSGYLVRVVRNLARKLQKMASEILKTIRYSRIASPN